MYNSILINIIMIITRKVQDYYSNSLIHRIISKIKNILSTSFNNSLFKKFFNSLEYYFKNTVIYKSTKLLFRIIDTILNGLYKFYNNYLIKSETISGVDDYTKDYRGGFRFVYTLLVMIPVVFGIYYIRGNGVYSVYPLIVSMIIGLIGFGINGRELDIIKGSKLIGFFVDIFELDKGGENWW